MGSSPVDSDAVNNAALPLCAAIAPRMAANLALSAADAIDHALECAPPEMIAGIETAGGNLKLNRSEYRLEHLEAVKQVVESAKSRA